MKYIITENKLEQVIIQFLNKKYGELEEYRRESMPNSIYFLKDGKVYIEYDILERVPIIGYDEIWEVLENIFSLKYEQIQSILDKWLEYGFNLKGRFPRPGNSMFWQYVEKEYEKNNK